MPAWFVQGLEEYFAVLCSTDYWTSEGIKYYYRRLLAVPHGIDTSFGLVVSDPYNDGFLLVHFIAERYGEKTVFQILLDPEPSFGTRLRTHLDTTFERFVEDLEKWKCAKRALAGEKKVTGKKGDGHQIWVGYMNEES